MNRPKIVLARSVFETPLGWMGVDQTEQGLRRLVFGHQSPQAVIRALDHDLDGSAVIDRGDCELQQRLLDYSQGHSVEFDAIPLDLPRMTPFQRRVTDACRRIRFGQTSTYQRLAESVGSPQAARAVGNVMAHNPVPLVVPCHRVLAANRKLGGFSAPGGTDLKLRLLELEQAAASCAADRFHAEPGR